jgi:hypothetical protein
MNKAQAEGRQKQIKGQSRKAWEEFTSNSATWGGHFADKRHGATPRKVGDAKDVLVEIKAAAQATADKIPT